MSCDLAAWPALVVVPYIEKHGIYLGHQEYRKGNCIGVGGPVIGVYFLNIQNVVNYCQQHYYYTGEYYPR